MQRVSVYRDISDGGGAQKESAHAIEATLQMPISVFLFSFLATISLFYRLI